MVDRIRLFKGSTELGYSACAITKTNDQIINKANIEIEPDSPVTSSSVIDFKKNDGTTTIFSAKVEELKEEMMWIIECMTNGYELNNIRVEQVYTGQSPEAIVQDVIDTYCPNLTYSSSSSSGITLDKYIANAYAIDIIKDMLYILNWQLIIDETDAVTFEPQGNLDNSKTFYYGGDNSNITITQWNEDKSDMINSVKVIGGFESFRLEETITDSNTVFTLSRKPSGTMRVLVSSSEVDPSQYTVDAEEKTVTFTSSKTNPTFEYSYSRPVVVFNQDDKSITTLGYGERFKELQAPWLNTSSDARSYSQKVLDALSLPLTKAKGKEPQLNFTQEVGELVTVVDVVRNKTRQLVITKIVLDAETNETKYEFGPRDFLLTDWQAEVMDRIKKLERRFLNAEDVIFARVFKHNLDVSLSVVNEAKINWPRDSFLANHETLGRARSSLNLEADCSNNSHNGTWSGTGVDGSQYSVKGWRLSTGLFNGSDRIITVPDHSDLDLSSDFAIMFAVKVSSLPGAQTYLMNKWDGTDGWAVRINASNQVELIYSNSGSDSTITASTALTANTYQHVAFVKNGTGLTVYIDSTSDNTDTGDASAGTNSNDLVIGNYSSSYFNGELDELRIYSDNVSSSIVSNVYNRISETTNLVCYLSMDNPRAGDRASPKIVHVSSTSFKLDLTSTDADGGSTNYWDISNKRLAMSDSDNHLVTYNTMAITGQIYFTGKSFSAATLTADETIWGNDVVMYFLTPDGGDNWYEVQNGQSYSFPSIENDLRAAAVFIGNGGTSTYIENVTLSVTRV